MESVGRIKGAIGWEHARSQGREGGRRGAPPPPPMKMFETRLDSVTNISGPARKIYRPPSIPSLATGLDGRPITSTESKSLWQSKSFGFDGREVCGRALKMRQFVTIKHIYSGLLNIADAY